MPESAWLHVYRNFVCLAPGTDPALYVHGCDEENQRRTDIDELSMQIEGFVATVSLRRDDGRGINHDNADTHQREDYEQ